MSGIVRAAKKIVRSPIFRAVAPIALGVLAPGVGTAIGAGLGASGAAAPILGSTVLGAGLGAAQGQGLKGAALGALSGGLSGGGANALVGASGLTGTAASAASKGLTGAATGGFAGGREGALMGGLGGAALGALGTASTVGAGGMGPATQGSGLLGSATRAINTGQLGSGALANVAGRTAASLGGGLGGMGSLSSVGNLASLYQQNQAQEDIQRQLSAAQGRVQEAIAPYSEAGGQAVGQLSGRLQEGFNPQDLTQDPGYQFQMQQGQEALNRQLAASGMMGSGAALKAAQDYGQGLAGTTYDNAYQRWLAQNQQIGSLAGQGLGAAGTQAASQAALGDISANRTAGRSNVISQGLSGVLGGRIVGYNPDGTPIYG